MSGHMSGLFKNLSGMTTIISSFAFGFVAVYLFKYNLRSIFTTAGSVGQLQGGLKMALVVRTDLKMGKGKAAAQCAHAAISCYKRALFGAEKELHQWDTEGQPKVVLATSGEKSLLTLAQEAKKAGLIAVVIHDAGHTQVVSGTATVVGIGPGPQDMINKVVGHLKLF